jgi:hypothetical protein
VLLRFSGACHGTMTAAACWRADGTPVAISGGQARARLRFAIAWIAIAWIVMAWSSDRVDRQVSITGEGRPGPLMPSASYDYAGAAYTGAAYTESPMRSLALHSGGSITQRAVVAPPATVFRIVL